MEPRIIKTDEQYRHFRGEVERLAVLDPEPESPQGVRLELLAKLVEDYEKIRFAFAKPDPIDAILFRMEQQGLRQRDIAPLLGGKNRASEVLSRKRSLTLPMIRALYEKLDIPLGLLVREPGAEYTTVRTERAAPRLCEQPEYPGFEGFILLGRVRSRVLDVPAEFGVYMVVWPRGSAAKFRKRSDAGWFKDKDPSYPVEVLRSKWVRDAGVIYIGKAGPTARRTLRRRISELVRFGLGEPVAHRGGRALGSWRKSGTRASRGGSSETILSMRSGSCLSSSCENLGRCRSRIFATRWATSRRALRRPDARLRDALLPDLPRPKTGQQHRHFPPVPTQLSAAVV